MNHPDRDVGTGAGEAEVLRKARGITSRFFEGKTNRNIQNALAEFGEIGQNGFAVFIKDFGADRHPQDDIIAILAGALVAHARLAVLGKEMLLIAEVDQRVQPVDGFHHHIAAPAAIAAFPAAIRSPLVSASVPSRSKITVRIPAPFPISLGRFPPAIETIRKGF